jgi:hypothetical protein
LTLSISYTVAFICLGMGERFKWNGREASEGKKSTYWLHRVACWCNFPSRSTSFFIYSGTFRGTHFWLYIVAMVPQILWYLLLNILIFVFYCCYLSCFLKKHMPIWARTMLIILTSTEKNSICFIWQLCNKSSLFQTNLYRNELCKN